MTAMRVVPEVMPIVDNKLIWFSPSSQSLYIDCWAGKVTLREVSRLAVAIFDIYTTTNKLDIQIRLHETGKYNIKWSTHIYSFIEDNKVWVNNLLKDGIIIAERDDWDTRSLIPQKAHCLPYSAFQHAYGFTAHLFAQKNMSYLTYESLLQYGETD